MQVELAENKTRHDIPVNIKRKFQWLILNDKYIVGGVPSPGHISGRNLGWLVRRRCPIPNMRNLTSNKLNSFWADLIP